MKIDLKADLTIRDIKTTFHETFKFLKLEFFSDKKSKDIGFSKDLMIDNETSLQDLMHPFREGSVHLTGKTTVKAFEHEWMEKFGLNVQVFRKSGLLYLETTSTDEWTLEQQNNEGETASKLEAGEAPRDELDRDQWE